MVMKKYITSLLFLVSVASDIYSQSSYEVAKLLESNIVGTARYVSMAGSMGALGTDISVMGVNPAGIGLYRTGIDASVTFALNSANIETELSGNNKSVDNTTFSIDNAGVVISNPTDFENVKFVNFGFNYKHRNNLEREFLMAGGTNGFSQMYQMQALYDVSRFDMLNMSYMDYTSLKHSWLALLGADGGLLDAYSNPQGELLYPNTTSMIYNSKEDGGVDQMDFNISCNINDMFYLGLTLGIYNVDYTRSSYYGEDDEFGELYTICNRYATEGVGFDVKLGGIIRPIKESSLRFGFAIHTPTWYSLTDRMSADIYGVDFEGAPYGGYMSTLDYEYAYGDDFYIDYRLSTTWRFNLSAAYTFGTILAVNAEYEYADYSAASMKYADGGGEIEPMNEELKNNMKAVNSFKFGAELKIDKNFSLRGGYNYTSAPYKKEATKVMIAYTDTNTEYLNSFEQSNYTLGLGYRGKMFYLDAAYVLSVKKGDFYPFYDTYENEDGNIVQNPGATAKDIRNRFVVTAGMRF